VNKNSQINLANENSNKVSVFSIESTLNINNKIPLQKIEDPLIQKSGINLLVLRTDLTHPTVSGNKWYKLKYNLVELKQKRFNTLLTFGGGYAKTNEELLRFVLRFREVNDIPIEPIYTGKMLY